MDFLNRGIYPAHSEPWFKFEYSIKTILGEKYFVPLPGSEPIDYDPMDYTPLESRPKKREEQNSSPHIHLAGIKLDNEEQICTFINRWGVLGVRELTYPVVNYRESLEDFIGAAKEFQSIFPLIEKGKDKTFNPGLLEIELFKEKRRRFDGLCEATTTINKYLRECHPWLYPVSEDEISLEFKAWNDRWSAPSLLKKCYLLVWMDLTKQRDYGTCAHKKCGRPYPKARSDQHHCSEQCKDAAKSAKNYEPVKERRKWLKEDK